MVKITEYLSNNIPSAIIKLRLNKLKENHPEIELIIKIPEESKGIDDFPSILLEKDGEQILYKHPDMKIVSEIEKIL